MAESQLPIFQQHLRQEKFIKKQLLLIISLICTPIPPISPEFRLATCLYRLGRGDYTYTISEMTGLGVSTVCNIVVDVSEAIIKELWTPTVGKHFPSSKEDFLSGMTDFEQLWQFCYAFAAIDGCHIPIKCPPGGRKSNKEYHNFKEFFSIVLMVMVDAKGRFIWANCGIPGNTHDSLIFQSTNMHARIVNGYT